MDSLPPPTQNENSVIIYSPLCHFKPIRLLLIFETQMKIFLIKSERFFFNLSIESPFHQNVDTSLERQHFGGLPEEEHKSHIVGFIKYVWVSKLRIFIFGLAKLSI